MVSQNIESFIKVLVRAYADEPVVLNSIAQSADTVEVTGSNPLLSISYPKSFVFPYDRGRFELLRTAFEEGDRLKLSSLWAGMDQESS